MESANRSTPYKRNVQLEQTLQQLERLIGGSSDGMQFKSSHPLLFIMGCARSGTTLLSQLLAQYTDWCYPTNLISRFYYDPYIGAMIQRMLVNLDDKGELLGDYKFQMSYNSDLGKTKGLLSPHEFWYYWRRYFKFGVIQKLDEKTLKEVDIGDFANGLHAIQSVFNKPIFLKGMILNWNIPYLARNFPNAYFIYLKRDIRYNAQSLLLARERFFGDRDLWYSFKPPEYFAIKKKSPEEQVVEQVLSNNRAIESSLNEIQPNKTFTLSYEELCSNVGLIIQQIVELIGSTRLMPLDKIMGIENNNRVEVDSQTWARIESAAMKLDQ